MIILRHDVDNAYFSRTAVRMHNYLSGGLLYGGLTAFVGSVYYLGPAKRLLEFDLNHGVKASWFFRVTTRPTDDFRKLLGYCGHDVGFHADKLSNQLDFLNDLRWVMGSCEGPKRGLGLTRHGNRGLQTPSRIGGEGEVYDEELCVWRAQQQRFHYFSGNKGFVEGEKFFRVIDGLVLFPRVFQVSPGYMNPKYDMDWLLDHKHKQDFVLVVHPEDLVYHRESVEKIYKECRKDMVSFKQYLEKR